MTVEVQALPPGATLLHIGLPKTGTTAVQAACAMSRGILLEHGVCYPGISLNHGTAANALMGRSTPVFPAGGPARWARIADERRRYPDAIGLISYEQIAQAEPATARRFVDELGPELHVVITARAFASLVPSAWQQWVKDGGDAPFETWLTDVLGAEGGFAVDPRRDPTFRRQYDLPRIAQTWVDLVGPARVHVVVLDKARPRLLFDAFEGLLGLPEGALAAVPRNSLLSNRGLSLAEAELVRGVNSRMHEAARPVDPRAAYRVLRNGAVSGLLRDRVPGADEGRVAPTAEWSGALAAVGAQAAAALRDLGVHIIGDAAGLADVAPDAPTDPPAPPAHVTPELPAAAVMGAVLAATARDEGRAGGRLPGRDVEPPPVSRRAVVRELRRRIVAEGAAPRPSALTLCQADERVLADAHRMRADDRPVVVLRPLRLAAVLDRQDSQAAGRHPQPRLVAMARAWRRGRRVVRDAPPGARIVRPDEGGLGAAAGVTVPEPRRLDAGAATVLTTVGAGMRREGVPIEVREAVGQGAVLHALYSAPIAEVPGSGEMLDAAVAQAVVAGTVSVLLGHGVSFAGPDGPELVRAPQRGTAADATLRSLPVAGLMRLLLPTGRKT